MPGSPLPSPPPPTPPDGRPSVPWCRRGHTLQSLGQEEITWGRRTVDSAGALTDASPPAAPADTGPAEVRACRKNIPKGDKAAEGDV